MNKAQAAKYMNVSYNTMMQKYVPNGLKLIIVDGVVKFHKMNVIALWKNTKINASRGGKGINRRK